MRRILTLAVATLLVGLGPWAAAPLAAVSGATTVTLGAQSVALPAAKERPAVRSRRVLGHSLLGRPITAWQLGERGKPRVVVMATMHGDERQTRQILQSLRDGPAVRGLNLWVIPTYNPDGYARGTRRNARGVDLNRNFPNNWADLDGDYESGTGPRSEPETRAVIRFLDDVNPRWVVSFHQPLFGVDTDTKSPALARRLVRELRLPRKSFRCGGVCHGTMTGWFNNNHRGAAITVEYGARPSRERMQVRAPRQLLRALGGRRVRN